MSTSIAKIEKRLIGGGTNAIKHLVSTGIEALSDYKERHLAGEAASVSFYAIFSAFPLLAFTVYIVGRLIGDETHSHSAEMVLKILRDFVPAMQSWTEKGLFDAISGHAATTWVNAGLLGWASLGLFGAVLDSIEALPEDHVAEHRAHVTQLFLGLVTFGLFAIFIVTVVFCEMAGKSGGIPFWLKGLPFEVQDVLYFGAHTHLLLGVVSVGLVMALYKILMPVSVSLRSALIGAATFATLQMLSRSAYWIYLHYNQQAIASSYGVFSELILIMLWMHFSVSCLLYGGLLALHLDRARAGGAGAHGAGDQHGHGQGSHDAEGEHKHAA